MPETAKNRNRKALELECKQVAIGDRALDADHMATTQFCDETDAQPRLAKMPEFPTKHMNLDAIWEPEVTWRPAWTVHADYITWRPYNFRFETDAQTPSRIWQKCLNSPTLCQTQEFECNPGARSDRAR